MTIRPARWRWSYRANAKSNMPAPSATWSENRLTGAWNAATVSATDQDYWYVNPKDKVKGETGSGIKKAGNHVPLPVLLWQNSAPVGTLGGVYHARRKLPVNSSRLKRDADRAQRLSGDAARLYSCPRPSGRQRRPGFAPYLRLRRQHRPMDRVYRTAGRALAGIFVSRRRPAGIQRSGRAAHHLLACGR